LSGWLDHLLAEVEEADGIDREMYLIELQVSFKTHPTKRASNSGRP
jgi:hypothetical protein